MGALRGGMPMYKYIFNRFLTFSQNLLVNYKLSDYYEPIGEKQGHIP
jgi:hypothetical protein